jgi:adenine-specific DNA-methyltransferase
MAIETRPGDQKLRGAYYTPRVLADFLVTWAVRTVSDKVLDQACGDAVFLCAARDRLRALGRSATSEQVTGIEIDPPAVSEAQHLVPGATILQADFFDVSPEATILQGNFFDLTPSGMSFNAVVGNPPYVRYHYFTGAMRERARSRARAQGVELTQLTSSWAPFLVHASTFLAPDGRLAFVLPAELLSTDYAAPVRDFLRQRFARIDVLTFEERIFPGAMVDAVLLLASGTGPGAVHVHRLRDMQALDTFDPWTTVSTHASKWTDALIAPAAATTLDEIGDAVQTLGTIASVDIGIVTGANAFFLLNESRVREAHLPEADLRPLIARGHQLTSSALSRAEWERRRDADEIVWLFTPQHAAGAAGDYIRYGEELGVDEAYKCSIRKPWWRLKVPTSPDLLLSYMSNHAPRLVANDASVITSNLLHNVRLCDTADAPERRRALALAWTNSATLLSCELRGRTYGGGVLKLETREAERVVVPRLTTRTIAALMHLQPVIDALLQQGDLEAVADLVDLVVLPALDPASRMTLRHAWRDLRQRRKRRSVPAARGA